MVDEETVMLQQSLKQQQILHAQHGSHPQPELHVFIHPLLQPVLQQVLQFVLFTALPILNCCVKAPGLVVSDVIIGEEFSCPSKKTFVR